MLKYVRSLTSSVVHETAFIGMLMFMAYNIGDFVNVADPETHAHSVQASGVVSLIIVALIFRTYGYYSLSP